MKITVIETHKRSYSVVLDEKTLKHILAENVSLEAGLSDEQWKQAKKEVQFKKRDSSTGYTTEAHITLTLDLSESE